MTRRTVEAIVQVTYEENPRNASDYTSNDLADDIRDPVFKHLAEWMPADIVIMSVTGGDEQHREAPAPVPATHHAGRPVADRPQA